MYPAAGTAVEAIRLGEPVPWFAAATLTGGRVDLHVDAGRWVVLAFIPNLAADGARQSVAAILGNADLFDESRMVCHLVLRERPNVADSEVLRRLIGPGFNVLIDEDGSVSAAFGIEDARGIVLDPMLRAVANLPLDGEAGSTQFHEVLRSLPDPDAAAGTDLVAPVLTIPRAFDFELCDFLVEMFEDAGGEESGFLLDRDGITHTVVDVRLKRRRDLVVGDGRVKELMRRRVASRIIPAIERFFQFRATRMDRYMVSRYDGGDGGHFFRHRDNVNAGAAHRRFAVTIGLNKGFEGGELRFPEFGGRLYTAPVGTAIVFSTGMLHEVLPVRSGSRYVFVPFLYGEADAARRLENNRMLAAGETRYRDQMDRLDRPFTAEPD